MSISIPSKEIYAVDIPEVKQFAANFRYNFHTPDESVSEIDGVPSKILSKQALEVDSTFIQYSTTRAPRMVVFSWKTAKLNNIGNATSDLDQRNNVFTSNAQNGTLILDNLDKVITEDHFSSNNYVSVNFHDGEIDDKIYSLVSGSFAMHLLNEQSSNSAYKSAHKLSAVTPKYIKPHFLFRSLGNQRLDAGVRFFDENGHRLFNDYFRRLKSVSINTQINSKLFHDITNRTIRDPHAQFASDMSNLHKFTKKLQNQVVQKMSLQVSESDYKTFVPFIDIRVRNSASQHNLRGSEIVGYIIDKTEISSEGSIKACQPIVIDNPRANTTADYQVKYNSTYVYSIRTIAQFTLPAIDDDTGDIASIKILVSSKPSSRIYVQTTEAAAPPPPADVNFTWDYERINPLTSQFDSQSGKAFPATGQHGSLLIHWTFPTNSQRDIKRFQVFRRRDIYHPFELIKEFNFDDSTVKYDNNENPDFQNVEVLKSPVTYMYDDDFFAGNHFFQNHHQNKFSKNSTDVWSSTFIYAIASIDAHGYTSGYSAQFQVWFDPFKNQLQKKLISHSGAPKQYPNLYLEADTFVDTINVSGPSSKRLKIIFNPEFYYVSDDSNRMTRTIATKQTGGSYKLQFINVDNQKSAIVNIDINDQLRTASRTLSFPDVRFGVRRKTTRKSVISQ